MISKIKKYITKVKKVKVDQFTLLAPPEHKIQDYLSWLKYYSRNLPRIAKYIESKYKTFNIIDVGANIGDSVALFRSADVNQHIYAIEGEPSYYKILETNLKQFSNTNSFRCFLGEKTQREQLLMKADQGTGTLSSNCENFIEVRKLDDLIEEHDITNIKLLKIDTDGFDLKILRGSLASLAKYKPVLFFEYDASYLEAQNENGMEIFATLARLGYNKILYYDNYGKLLISISTSDTMMIKQLYAYITRGEGAFYYYDVCVFHKDDDDLANIVIDKEMQFFDNNKYKELSQKDDNSVLNML